MEKTDVIKLGFFGLSASEVNLFRTIIESSDRLIGEWTITDKGFFDVIIRSPDRVSGLSDKLEKDGVIIPVHRRSDKPTSLHILKPYRADEIIDSLNSVLDNQEINDNKSCEETVKSGKRYRLKSWPKQHVLSADKGYLHLATYLSRRPLTHNELMSVSHQSDELCKRFIGLLLKEGLIDIVSVKPNLKHSNNQADTSFLGLLKNRLGLRE